MKIKFYAETLDIMILSSVEKYKSEVIGLLFGHHVFNSFIIKMGLPLVTAETTFTAADYSFNRVKRIPALYPELIDRKRKFLGFYHSHTQYGDIKAIPQMSDIDKESFIQTEDAMVEIILAINDYQRYVEWAENMDGTISGTCDNYHVKIAGYNKQDDQIKRTHLSF